MNQYGCIHFLNSMRVHEWPVRSSYQHNKTSSLRIDVVDSLK